PAPTPAPAANPPAAPAPTPGAWPTAAPAGGGRRPGGWPTATPAGGGTQPPAASGGAPAPQPAAPAPAPTAGAAPAYAPPSGGVDPRMLWPNILEAVKNRRRFTWILLSQNAQVTGFDGTTLQLGFVNAGARDNFAGSGSEDVLRQALAEQFNVQWKIEAVIDPSGGGSAPPSPGGSSGFGGGGGGGGYGGGGNAGYGGGGTSAQRPATPQPTPTASTPPPSAPAPTAAPTPASRPSAAPEPPPPVSIEDDIPEDDDPDLNESALSGYDLIVRELGATVVEEFTNE
ncbi:DNA polymerase III subunit gamma/tau, partial [Streptomyces viridochromogenes]